MLSLPELLRAHDVSPTPRRLAIARYVLCTDEHPSADRVLEVVRREVPTLSRATVYSTLATFVERGLLRRVELDVGVVLFDPNLAPHHHFVDEQGRVTDLPADALKVQGLDALEGIVVERVEVVVRGRRLH